MLCVKIAQQYGVLHQGKVHLANQVKLQLPGDEASDRTVAMTVIEATPYYDPYAMINAVDDATYAMMI